MNNHPFREMSKTGTLALSNEGIMATCPSVFAESPHTEVSDRYGFLPTINVVDALRAEGWFPVDATQRNVRDASKRSLTTHLVRFRRLGDEIRVGDSVVELLLKNSHDRSSAFVLHAGIFRMACANGIVIADRTFQKLSVRHGKNVVGHIIDGAYSVVDEVPKITNSVEEMMGITLSEQEQRIFAKTAFEYTQGEIDPAIMLTPTDRITNQLLRPRRTADVEPTLWNTFNCIQETTLKGGITTRKVNANGRSRQSTTRQINAIDKKLNVNKALWSMAEEMKALKTA